MVNIKSIIQDNTSLTFFITKDEGVLVREGFIKVNGKVKKSIVKVEDSVSYQIVYDKDYIDGYNNITLEVIYYVNGEKFVANCTYIHEKTFLFPLFNVTHYAEEDDGVDVYFDIVNQVENHIGIDVFINHVLVQSLTEQNSNVIIPKELFNNDINNISFVIKYNHGISVVFVYKAMYIEGEIEIISSWIVTKPIYSDKVKRYARVTYIADKGVYCFYSINQRDFYRINSGEYINLNNDFIKLMFVIGDGSRLKSYKVNFSDFIL